jgi:TRAP-type mannitol/chloroaromatic compound transport system permease small subunit
VNRAALIDFTGPAPTDSCFRASGTAGRNRANRKQKLRKIFKAYVTAVDEFNRVVGRITMHMIFAMMAVLLWSSFNKVTTGIRAPLWWPWDWWPVMQPSWWPLEVSQFMMVAYFLLGGAYSMQLGDHVRMDLLYGAWSDSTKAFMDVLTVCFLIFYLVILLYGGISSTQYALQYNEISPSLWRPQMAPIKIIMCTGIFLMLLQATSTLIKDIAKLKGEQWGRPETPSSDAADAEARNGGQGA